MSLGTATTVRMRALIGLVVGLLIGALIFATAYIATSNDRETLVLQVAPAPDPALVQVSISGSVVQPGIYTLPRGSSIGDAIAAAGGPTAAADLASLALGAPLSSGDQIVVPTLQATTPATPGDTPQTLVAGNGPVNINTADAATLETLPGIGPALAQKIIDYRSINGPFQTVDELAEISGISAAMVAKLRPLITIGP